MPGCSMFPTTRETWWQTEWSQQVWSQESTGRSVRQARPEPESDAWPTDAKSKPGRRAARRPTKRSATLMKTNCSLRREWHEKSHVPARRKGRIYNAVSAGKPDGTPAVPVLMTACRPANRLSEVSAILVTACPSLSSSPSIAPADNTCSTLPILHS